MSLAIRAICAWLEARVRSRGCSSAGKAGLTEVKVDAAYVDGRLGDLAGDEDLSRYVL